MGEQIKPQPAQTGMWKLLQTLLHYPKCIAMHAIVRDVFIFCHLAGSYPNLPVRNTHTDAA